jgi:hypothetical protein
VVFSSLQADAGKGLEISHHFLTHPFQSFFHSTLYSLSYEGVKSQLNK